MKKFIHKVQDLSQKAAHLKKVVEAAPAQAAHLRDTVLMTAGQLQQLRHDVPRLALETPVPGGGTMHDLAREVIDLASLGLTRRAVLNPAGDNEGGFLDPLREVVASGMTPADRLLEKYRGEWGGDVRRIYEEMSF